MTLPLIVFLAALWLILYIADHLPITPALVHTVVCVGLALVGLIILLHGYPIRELRW